MTTEFWLTLIGSCVVATTIPALFAMRQSREQLRQAKPHDDAQTNALNLEAQGKTLDRISRENERLSEKIQQAQDDAAVAFALAKDQGERLEALERKQQSAVRFIGQLISVWPKSIPIPAIPNDLVEDVGPHIVWPLPRPDEKS